jgi:aminoglycoside phosphotransferase family enzyme
MAFADEVSVGAKVAFLSRPGCLPGGAGPPELGETHMSWVFFAGDRVYKLKKPVRLPYLDFSTVGQRLRACAAEHELNRDLAPGIYLQVLPICRAGAELRLGGPGEIVDGLVVMRRLDQGQTLEARLLHDPPSAAELDALADRLARFYRHARRRRGAPEAQLRMWRDAIRFNRRVLLLPRLGMPAGAVRYVTTVQQRFLRTRPDLLAARLRDGRVVDAHGDLRPEHVWMGSPILIIDRLEFSAALRTVDWLDELSFLEVETTRLGAAAAGARVRRQVCARLHDEAPEALRLFYVSCRALLRARLAIAHLLEPHPRTPDKWPRQARAYLDIALRSARRLEATLRTPSDR